MSRDASWDIFAVANPQLRKGRRRRLIREILLRDPAGLPEPLYQLRHRDQIVAPSALDATCRQLLQRTQAAIDLALDSGDDATGLPDIVTERTLRQHEWEIAVALRDITDLRAEHELNSAAMAGPMTAAVLEPHQRAVQLAHDAILSRVTALERYAAEIGAAEIAYRDWQDALRVSDWNDRYLDLVARTAADEHAVSEIRGLTEQAAAAAQTFRDTVGQVSQAAAALALPEPEAR
jgi:PAS domain-containing protein